MQVISDIFSNFVPNLITLLLKKLMEQKDQGSKAYLISIVMVAVLGGLLFGYDTAVIS